MLSSKYIFDQLIEITINKSHLSLFPIHSQVKLNDINDNCPQLDVREYYAVGVPPMTVSPYMKINATDEDSTFNAELEHRVTTPVLELVYYEN